MTTGNGNNHIRITKNDHDYRERQDADLYFIFAEEKRVHIRLWTDEEIYIHKSSEGLNSDLFKGNLFGTARTLKLKGPVYTEDFHILNKIVHLESIDLSETYIYDKTGEIPANAFHGCSLLNEVIFPRDTYSIGQFAFSGCSSLESVIIPENVVKISSYAFVNCKALKRVELPSTMKVLETKTFANSELSEIKCNSVIPPKLNTTFSSIMYDNAIIIVPKGCLTAYQNDDNWHKFKDIIEE